MGGQRRVLVGREHELAALAGVVDRAIEGTGGVALVTGEPGIGKTSLLEHAAARGGELGCAVVWGRAWEVGGAPAHWIWIEALRALVDAPCADAASADRVRSLVLDAAASAAEPFHQCDAVARFVTACAARNPVLIVFDDLHAADVASLEIALFVARQLAGARVALVGSYRDVEARMSPAVEDKLAKIGRLGQVVSVPRLERDAVARLVREQVGHDDAITEMVMDATEGNPLFVRELLQLIRERAAAPGVPAGVRAVIRERLGLLSPATVALLQAAAVVGRDCSIPLAAAVAGVTPDALERAAAEAAAAALVDPMRTGRLRFSHAVVAETLAADLAAPVRARLHRTAAETLEARHADDPAAPVAEIARHWLSAGTDAAPRAVDAAERAAAAASARLAFTDAAQLLDQATTALATAAPADTRRRVELMLARCEALARGGDRAGAEVLCHEAAKLARTLQDDVLFARVALALGAELIVGHPDPEVKRLLDEALARLPEGDSPWRARVAARLAGARQPEVDTTGPIAQALDAIAMARRLGDEDTLLYALHAGMAALVDYAPPEQRLVLDRETAVLAAARGAGPYEVRARSRILFDCVDLFDAAAFDAELDALDALVARLDVPRYRWVPAAFRAMRADWRGAFDEADRHYADASQLAGSSEGPFRFTARALMRRVLIDRELDVDQERDWAVTMLPGDAGFRRLLGAFVDARAGRLDEARAAVRATTETKELDAMLGTHDLHGAQLIASIAWHTRDPDLARRAYDVAAPLAGRAIALTGIGYMLYGTADQLCMRMAITRERWEDMDRHAAAALRQCEQLGARVVIAHIYADWAAGTAARGTDPTRARELARAGRALADELGMTRVAERCAALLDGDAPAAASATVTLTREGEYWTLRGCGEVCRMRDSRGVQMLALLVERPGREAHVLELSGSRVADGGDAGALLDADARAAYEARARDLRAELDEADAFNDPGRRERARAELDALAAELSRAFGLGGRERRAANATERARSNVRRRIADAMSKIANAAPAIGAHLDATIKTGVYCSYTPPQA